MILWKCYTQYSSKFGKLSSGQRIGKGSFHSNPKERQCQRMLKIPQNCSHLMWQQSNAQNSPSKASTVHEPRTFRRSSWIQKTHGNHRSNCQDRLIIEKEREFQKKNICFIDYAKTFDCMDHNKLWEILQEMVIPDHLTCLLRNLTYVQVKTNS